MYMLQVEDERINLSIRMERHRPYVFKQGIDDGEELKEESSH